MIAQVESVVVAAGLIVLGLAACACFLRILRGPTIFDRVLAFDCAVLQLLGVVLLAAVRYDVVEFVDVVLVVALLGFVGTISFAAYLEGNLVD